MLDDVSRWFQVVLVIIWCCWCWQCWLLPDSHQSEGFTSHATWHDIFSGQLSTFFPRGGWSFRGFELFDGLWVWTDEIFSQAWVVFQNGGPPNHPIQITISKKPAIFGLTYFKKPPITEHLGVDGQLSAPTIQNIQIHHDWSCRFTWWFAWISRDDYRLLEYPHVYPM